MKPILGTFARVLTLTIRPADVAGFGRGHLAAGLVATWIVGVGRWWDDRGAHLIQHLGLGSLAYVFVLAGLLWLVALPLRPRFPKYSTILTYVTLTAPPAALYALPVERWTGLQVARQLNVWFLAIVASWRTAMYLAWLLRVQSLRTWVAVTAGLLPLAATVVVLTILNLERAVFDLMSGLRPDGTQHDVAYIVLVNITVIAVLATPVLGVAYVIAVFKSRGRAAAAEGG